MKKFIIKNAMALVALAIATGSYTLMSFGLENNSLQNDQWFEFNSGSPYESGAYDPNPVPEPDNCEEGENMCAIQTNLSEGQPNLTPELIAEIENALTLGVSTTNVRVKE